MPFVRVNVVGSLSVSGRRTLSGGIARVLETVAGKPPEVTYVTFVEQNEGTWGRGAEVPGFCAPAFPLTEVKAAGALTVAQRQDIAAGIEAVLLPLAAAGNPPGYVIIEEVPRQAWARGGRLLEGA